MIIKYLIPVVLIVASSTTSTFAAVTLVGTGPTVYGNTAVSDNFGTATSTTTESFSFGAANDSVFAVTLFAFKGSSTPSVTLDPTGLNVGLTLLDSNVSTNNSDLRAFVFGANLGTIGAGDLDFTVDWDTSSSLAAIGSAQAYQLSGTTIAGAVTNSTGIKDTALPLNGLAAGSFAITLLADGNASSSEGAVYGSPTATGGYNGWGNRGQTWGYYENVSGDITTGVNGIAAQVSVSAAFTPVPEPSAYALFAGLIALGGILIRRRIRD